MSDKIYTPKSFSQYYDQELIIINSCYDGLEKEGGGSFGNVYKVHTRLYMYGLVD